MTAAHDGSNGGRQPGVLRRTMSMLRLALLMLLIGYMLKSLVEQAHDVSGFLSVRGLWALGLAAACLSVNLMLTAYRQVLLLRGATVPLPMSDSIKITFAGHFANNFIPAGLGQDLIRLLFLSGRSGQTAAHVGGLLVLDRFLGVLGLSLLTLCVLLSRFWFGTAGIPADAGRFLVYSALLPFPFGAALLVLRHGAAYTALLGLVTRIPGAGRTAAELLDGLRRFSSRRRTLVQALLLATLGHSFSVLGVALITGELYGHGPALGSILVTPLVFFASALPVTPANIGWTETVAGATWSLFGLSGGVSIFLCWRVVCAAVSLFGARAYASLRRAQRQACGQGSAGRPGGTTD